MLYSETRLGYGLVNLIFFKILLFSKREKNIIILKKFFLKNCICFHVFLCEHKKYIFLCKSRIYSLLVLNPLTSYLDILGTKLIFKQKLIIVNFAYNLIMLLNKFHKDIAFTYQKKKKLGKL